MTDVVEAAEVATITRPRYLASQYYNNVTKKRSFYLVPYKTAVVPFHIWNSLVEKAGYKLSDAPKTWDAFWDFFKPMQKKLREPGHAQRLCAGLQPTTTGPADGNNMFHHFLIANGGNGIVTKDGKPHLDDPQVKEAVIKSLTYITDGVQGRLCPAGGAELERRRRQQRLPLQADGHGSRRHDLDRGRAVSRQGRVRRHRHHGPAARRTTASPMPAQLGVGGAFIPKGAKNVEVAKDFMKYVIQPQVMNDYLKQGLGRWLPAIPVAGQERPVLARSERPAPAELRAEGLIDETGANYPVFNPGWAEVNATQIWGSAEADVIRNGMTPEQAADNAFKKIETILAKYPIVQS